MSRFVHNSKSEKDEEIDEQESEEINDTITNQNDDEDDEQYEEYQDESKTDDGSTNTRITETTGNFRKFRLLSAYSENMMNELFANLPKEGRIDGKSVEQFISPLILQPLERLDDDIHNKFTLMHNDMDALFKTAYKVFIENEQELRDIIDVAFDKLNVYTKYIENNFELRHSPKHYLMRQLRVDHGKIIHLSMRKIMYYKYPEWVESDNWASEEMSDHNLRKFIISEKLGIGLENLENIDQELDASDGDDIDQPQDEIEGESQEMESNLNEVETMTDSVEEQKQQKEVNE